MSGGHAPSSVKTLLEGAAAVDQTFDEDETLIGTVLKDTYKVIDKLGEGGMAAVYLAEHVTIGKRVAVKVLFPEHAHRSDLVERFLQEARAASAIDHENVVEINDFGQTPTGSVFFVMEYLSGEDLADTIARQGRLPWPRIREIALQICAGLGAAHDRGIIHRDLKPENCFRISRRGTDDFIKVLDFGIAKVTQDADGPAKGLTKTGSIFGSPEYMPPEQAAGVPVDHRADIYSLGCILYELLTGRTPFHAETYMGLLTMHMYEPPLPPRQAAPDAEVPVDVEAIVLKAMQKSPDNRFQDMREFARAIESVGSGAGPVVVVTENIKRPRGAALLMGLDGGDAGYDEGRGRGRLIAIAAIVGALVIAGLAWALTRGEEPEPEPAPVEEKAPPPAPVKAPPEPPPAPAVVTLRVTAQEGIEGEVFDDRDDVRLGAIGEAIELPQREGSRDVRVEAEGYEHQVHEVSLAQDRELSVELVKAKRTRPSKSSKKKTTKKKSKTTGKKDPLQIVNPWDKKK
ncbi:MAG: serine/threonine protein kinase [Myxococcales bacterium]|nr:serine/threonine protein kinase [Myxococcales bacterium]MCB9753728.1 serine/threonine protein kinase [Myxococcales bacterium]